MTLHIHKTPVTENIRVEILAVEINIAEGDIIIVTTHCHYRQAGKRITSWQMTPYKA